MNSRTNVDAHVIAKYLVDYVKAYRIEYEAFVAPPPNGGGYPRLLVSPYLDSMELTVYLAREGVAIADYSWSPPCRWEIAGGPAIMVDYLETRTPPEVEQDLARKGLAGKHIGIYRVVSKHQLPKEVWQGELGKPINRVEETVEETRIIVLDFDLTWNELIRRLTHGAVGEILDLKLRDSTSPFWRPHVITRLGFLTADRNFKTFFNYLELLPHLDVEAWDSRSIPVRVQVDIRRDFARTISSPGAGGMISFGNPHAWVEHFFDRLSNLKTAINGFRQLLEEAPDADESVFHEYLENHTVLLDVYGTVESKPRFPFPDGESPLGKNYLEPDFLVRYPGDTYKLIEIEKPSKRLATVKGQPRAEVTQATFQVAEWSAYLKKHYEKIKDRYPGISVRNKTAVIISRTTADNIGVGRKAREYMELLSEQFATDEVLTYDDLLNRAEFAYVKLATLGIKS